MKWFFILLLIINVIYLGWEIDHNTKWSRANVSSTIKVQAGTQKLVLLSELAELPETRSHIKLDYKPSMINFNSEPILPIELNPNTEKIMKSLLPETSILQSDNRLNEKEGQEGEFLPDSHDGSLSPVSEKIVCYTYGPIPNQKESKLLSKWLNEKGILYKQRQTEEKAKQLFWIYLTPRDSRAQAEATMSDLKQKGVKDIRLIKEGDLLNAISLGIFSNQISVNRRLNEIKTKGYQSVVVPYSGGEKIYWIDVSIVKNSNYVEDLLTGFPIRFNALPVNCNTMSGFR